MKTLFSVIFTLFAAVGVAQQGSLVTRTLTVKGNCEECKERIENAADIKGVKITVWNADAQAATVTYDSTKTSIDQVAQAIASVGYDAGAYKGNDKKYRRLPKCCQYRDGKCEEPEKK